jgi:two-component system sensor histidine kinase ChvG
MSEGGSTGRIERSLASKLVLLTIVFIAVPVALYQTFLQAEKERQDLLLSSVQEQGRLVAMGLEPLLKQTDPSPLLALPDRLKDMAGSNTRIDVLLRPADRTGVDNFFYVAAVPAVTADALSYKREQLMRLGVLDNVTETCIGAQPLAKHYRDPEGHEEMLTSITPVQTVAGCWAIIISHPLETLLGSTIGQPYWQRFEVRVAAGIYLAMAVITMLVFFSIRRGVLRFRQLARDISAGEGADRSFAAQNDVAELAGIAEDFDRLVQTLRASADGLRQAAEDNAHAFKTPIAIMRQSLEPLRRIVPASESRGRRALDVLEMSIDRLDQLVSTARRMDETMAELLTPPRQRINLSDLLRRMAVAYSHVLESRNLRLTTRVEDNVHVRASEELLETVVENILDNSVSVSRPLTQITVELRRQAGWAQLTIQDQGPGVPMHDLERIFERRFSNRPMSGGVAVANGTASEHAGIGLWLVRRNLLAINGRVRAENAPTGGLVMRIEIPLAA